MAAVLTMFRIVNTPKNLCICSAIRVFSVNSIKSARLLEVGRIITPKLDGKYDTGQLFLHRIFGYRGVVLFPWLARVFDRDILKTKKGDFEVTDRLDKPEKDVKENVDKFSTTNTFYQVLIDSRDCPYIRAQTEAVTFLGNQDTSRSLYAIPGLDYVAHEDILPYTSTEKQPLQHELFDKFLQCNSEIDPPFQALDTLKAWQKKNHPWLELSDVHKETTENIRVTVIPFYMGWRENTSSYWWRYCIRLENLGEETVYLRERHWRIFSLSGTLETVRGRGVVGQEPVLSKHLPAFQYSSHVSLQCPAGHMWGTFKMERDDGYAFECKIPAFSLESKPEEKNDEASYEQQAATALFGDPINAQTITLTITDFSVPVGPSGPTFELLMSVINEFCAS